jgi:uncharacterized membrane protein YdbT with pleckstrin-like domain
MNYEKIWQKVLTKDENIEYEFSVGKGYIVTGAVTWGIISLLLLAAYWPVGLLLLLFTQFYFLFYVRAANAYAFTNKHVLVHRGWLSTHTISVDYPKITDVHIREPFTDRVVTHTGSIAIITAGSTTDQIILRHINVPYEIKKKLDALTEQHS